jgi:prophage regulatory protein
VNQQHRILLWPEVNERTGLSRTTAWREIRANRFPKPVRISTHRKGWVEEEVNDYIARRIAGRGAAARAS